MAQAADWKPPRDFWIVQRRTWAQHNPHLLALMNSSLTRRRFVQQTSTLTAAAAIAAPAILRSAESPGDKLLVGVMGLGRGLDHCNALLQISNRSEERRVGKECRSRWS